VKPIIRQYNASGEAFRIQGACKSACTMFLGIRNGRVERSATLMFHGRARYPLYRYNAALRQYVLDHHYMDTEEFNTLAGGVLIDRFGYRECVPQ